MQGLVDSLGSDFITATRVSSRLSSLSFDRVFSCSFRLKKKGAA